MTEPEGSPRDVQLSVVLCTRNRGTLLDRCLGAIADATVGPDVEIVVVDNGSTDRTADVAAGWSASLPVRYVMEATVGLSHARNAGLRHAVGEVLVFLDDDVVVRPGWLDAYADAYRRRPTVAGVAGRIQLDWPDGRPAWLNPTRETWFARLDLGDEPRLLANGERPVGANMSVTKRVAESVGGFDPRLGYSGSRLLGNEEIEFFDRVVDAGHDLAYEPRAEVLHVVEGRRVTRGYLIRRLHAQGRSDARLAVTAGEPDAGSRAVLRTAARRALGRALVRGWRTDVRRMLSERPLQMQIVDVVAGRARQLGVATESFALARQRGSS